MKKSKILLVAVLAVVLCFVCITTQTFSWFTLPRENKGDSLQWSEIAYNASTNSGITMATYESTDDGKTFGETAVTSLTNSSTGIAAGKRKYYRTDIINSSTSAQSVSLYLSNLTLSSNTGNFFLGVNSPTKTYKPYGGATTATGKVANTINKQNVYLALESVEVGEGKLTNNIDYVHAWNGTGTESDTYYDTMVDEDYTEEYTDNYGWKKQRTYDIYSATIDSRCTKFKLKTKNNNWMPPEPTISENNTLIFYEYGNVYYAEMRKSGTPAKLESFYSSATVGKGSSINIQATATGTSIQYSSSNSSVATVDSNGNVTGVAAGSATITVKVYGVYGDCLESTCSVLVTSSDKSLTDVPIVTNVLVPKGAGTETGTTVESVYWYIKNDATSGTLKYTISDVYLTL